MKRYLYWSLLLLLGTCAAARSSDIHIPGGTLRIAVVAPQIFHIQFSPEGKFKQSILQRYGMLKTDWPKATFTTSNTNGVLILRTSAAKLQVNTDTGAISLYDDRGEKILNKLLTTPEVSGAAGNAAYRQHQLWLSQYFRYNANEKSTGKLQGIVGQKLKPHIQVKYHYIERYLTDWTIPVFGSRIKLDDSERLYGLGEASQKRLSLRGYAYRNWVEYRGLNGFDPTFAKWEQTEGGIPFLMSTKGWALMMNTSWPTYFDFGAYNKSLAYIWGPFGHCDFYLFAGGTLRQNVNLYTQLSGRPLLLPLWGYGLWFDGNALINQFAMLEDGHNFVQLHFPVDSYSLEPSWMAHNYDLSHRANWNLQKFYLPDWIKDQRKPSSFTFIGAMRRLGMRMGLWFDCNDDLTLEAERMVAPAQRPGERIAARPHGWFHHLRKFEMEGIRAFKVDPYAIMNVHHGRKYFNGKRDLEMHNLTQSLLAQQMYEGAAAGGAEAPRIMTQYSGFYIGTQHWVANTMDDDSAGPGTLCWMLNLALTGNSNTTADMTPDQGAAVMQMAFFSGWTDIQSWCSSAEPWLYSHHVQAVFKYYDDLRHRLLPYIYSTAWHATQSGIPIMRPMPLMFPGSLQCANLTRQYMFGRDFLVAVFTHRVYLPKGQWFNYWTGRRYTGGRWVTPTVPADRGGPLFVRAGAIVPMWPVVQYVSHVPES
ncbi:MAG: DUF4968 domain-containing protein, partial [Phycisphaerales bacterium]|nr:DUF4968 domain-containing protein [Phycisphaerales bacterium]